MSLRDDLTPIVVKDHIIEPVIKYIKQIFPNQVIVLERQNVPRPKPPYFTINMLTPLIRESFSDSVTHQAPDTSVPVDPETNPDNLFRVSGGRRFTLTLQAYEQGKDKDFFDAQQKLEAIRNGFQVDSVRALLDQAGLSVFDSTDILDVTELLETGYEPRAQMDLLMGIASNFTVKQDVIERVRMDSCVTLPEETFTVNEEN